MCVIFCLIIFKKNYDNIFIGILRRPSHREVPFGGRGGHTDANVISGNRNQEIRIIRWVTKKLDFVNEKRETNNIGIVKFRIYLNKTSE